MNETRDKEYELEVAARLAEHGWTHMGYWLFFKGGKIYDLSAADLNQLDRIEREGLFVVAE